MNSVVEKLAAIEKEMAALQPKMAPLAERIAALDQKVTGFALQLTDLAAESAAVKQDIELTRQSLTSIQTFIGEAKTESEQLATEQEEHQQRYKAMETFVGTLYQLHSQSVQIAQWLGLADHAKAVFPAPLSVPETLTFPPAAELPEPPIYEPEPPAPEAADETIPGELPVEKLSAEEPSSMESILSESDFDSAVPDPTEQEPEPWAMPGGLPGVMAYPEEEMTTVPSDADTDAEPSSEMASQLDVPPLNLAVPALPEQNESATMGEEDEQEIEAMLAAMGTPVTVGQE